MGLPYNPSSFATNKTILQAIEELKEYLKNNPCYKVYYVNTPYVVGTYTYNLSDVDDPDDTMTPYDVVIFNNSYYAKVIVVDTSTFDIDPAISFKGATGPAGADGTDGVSITGVSIDASQHLIITLSDGNTIDAGALPTASFDIVEFNDTLSSGTFSASDLTLLKGDSTLLKGTYYGGHYYLEKYQYGYLYYESIHRSGNGTYSCECIRIDESTGAWAKLNTTLRENPRGTDIDSQTASLGQVLTADGNGGASWGTVSSGYVNTVPITSTSGTFSDSDFAKLGYGDSTIVYTDAYSVSTVYKLKLETASILEFEAIDAASRTNLKLIDVNKSTKAYSMTAISMITSSTISSGTATSGKVLTANGSGGCSWETAGGGSGKYAHYVKFNRFDSFVLSLVLITNDSEPYTSDNIISKITTNLAGGYLSVSGYYKVSSITYIATYIDVQSSWGSSYINGIKSDFTLNNTVCTTAVNSPNEVSDKVIAL